MPWDPTEALRALKEKDEAVQALRDRIAAERFPSPWENADHSLKPVGNSFRCIMRRYKEVDAHYYLHTAETIELRGHGTVTASGRCTPRLLWKLLREEDIDYEDELEFHDHMELEDESDPDIPGALLPDYYPIVLYESGCCPDPARPEGRVRPRSTVLPGSAEGVAPFVLDREGGSGSLIPIDWRIPGSSFPQVVRHRYKWNDDEERCLQLEKNRLWSDEESTRERDDRRFRYVYGREPDPAYNQGYYFRRVY